MLPCESSVLYCDVLCCIVLRCVALRCVALRCVALRCVALRCVALRCVALRCVALRCVALRCVALHCIALYCVAGITKFHQYSINELETSGSDPEDTQSMKSFRSSLSASGTSVLDGYVGHVREALGIESHLSTSR